MLAIDPKAQILGSTEVNSGVIEIPLGPIGDFDPALWQLLQDIKAAGIPLRGKIAEYAGFYYKVDATITTEWDPITDNGVNPDVSQTGASQPNKSLDKLTFLIMFRLPFRLPSANIFYGDPITGPNTTWSYRANQIRSDAGLFRLNQAGEQVNADLERCDDSGAALDSSPGDVNTPRAYVYYNNVGSDLSGLVAAAVKGQPIYLYLAVITEGKFNATPGDTTLTMVQMPENIAGLMGRDADKTPIPTLRRRAVVLGLYLPTGFTPSTSIPNFATTHPVNGAIIKKETSGAHINEYYVLPTNVSSTATSPRIYVSLKYPAEKLDQNSTHSLGATIFEMAGLEIITAAGTDPYYARYFTRNKSFPKFGFTGAGDIQFENLAILNRSGVTLGWGYDIGQGTRQDYQYKISFKIWARGPAGVQPPGTTEFTLRYKDRLIGVKFTAGEGDMESALRSLLVLKERVWTDGPSTIKVAKTTNSGDIDYPIRWDVTIIRANMDPQDGDKAPFSDLSGTYGFYNMYSSNIFYQKDALSEPVNPNIKITPESEKARYTLNTAKSAVKAWEELDTLLTHFFGGVDWRDPSHFTGATAQEISDFEDILRSSYAIRRGNGFLPVFNQYTLLNKFRLPSADLLFPRWVTFFIKDRYYDKKVAKLAADVRDRTNTAEKYVLTTIVYAGDFGKNADLDEAIRTKNLEKLISAVTKRNVGDTFLPRRTTIVKHLAPTAEQLEEGVADFKKYLYRNIEED